MDTLAIIKRIELRIAELGMSKSDFYKNSGISSASYSQWNTGKYNPTDKKLQKAAECLGVSLEYLRDGKEKAPAYAAMREVDKDNKTPPSTEEQQGRNVIKIAGRNGVYRERYLSDSQLAALESILDQLPDASDDL